MPLAAAESVIRDWLAGQFPNARVVTETPADMTTLPVIRVERFGGSDVVYTLDAANIDVDCYDQDHDGVSARENARSLAEQVRTALRLSAEGQSVNGALIAEVQTISAPTWTPYDNTNLRRFTASYRIAIRSIP